MAHASPSRYFRTCHAARGMLRPLPFGAALPRGAALGPARPHLADARLDLIDGLAQHPRRLLHAEALLRRQRQFDLLPHAAAADHRRHRQAHVADAVQSLLQAADRQHAAAVAGQRFDDFADRQADGEAGAALELDELRPRRLRVLERLAAARSA